MKIITRKKHLEMKLQSVPPHPKPKVELEQYTTPADIASDLIWNAYHLGDVENKKILDLGCGTGIFTFASSLMGANSVVGVDIDEDSIDLALEIYNKFDVDNVKFIVSDISDFNCKTPIDTVFQNPPFGSQKNAINGQDLKFVKKVMELQVNVLYSFHMASTEEFLINYYSQNGFDITHIFRYKFIIPHTYDFHKKEKQSVDVIVIRSVLL